MIKYIALLVFGLPGVGISQYDWDLFYPDDRSFQVLCPGKMEWGIKHILTDLGELKTITYLHKGKEENPEVIFIINYTDYPQEVLDMDSTELLESFFQTSLEGIKEKLAGELVYFADVSSFYIPQKIYKIVYNQGQAIVKGKMMVVGDRFYSVQVFSSFGKSDSPEIQKFLESFTPLSTSP